MIDQLSPDVGADTQTQEYDSLEQSEDETPVNMISYYDTAEITRRSLLVT